MMRALFLLLLLSDRDLILEYERRDRTVHQQLVERKQKARKHVMALYRLTKGGLGPWLVEPFGDLVARERALRKMVDRDLAELRLYMQERQRLASLHADVLRSAADGSAATIGLPLLSPTGGKQIIGPFGYHVDAASRLKLFRRGVLLASAVGQSVRSPAGGRVVYAAPMPELGYVVIISPDPDLFVVVGHLGGADVAAGATVAAGQPIGKADRPSVLLEVRRGTVPLDPEGFLRHASR